MVSSINTASGYRFITKENYFVLQTPENLDGLIGLVSKIQQRNIDLQSLIRVRDSYDFIFTSKGLDPVCNQMAIGELLTELEIPFVNLLEYVRPFDIGVPIDQMSIENYVQSSFNLPALKKRDPNIYAPIVYEVELGYKDNSSILLDIAGVCTDFGLANVSCCEPVDDEQLLIQGTIFCEVKLQLNLIEFFTKIYQYINPIESITSFKFIYTFN